MKKSILIVAAHPDDEILGCGGTVARLVREGGEAFALILGEGITSRDRKRDTRKRKKDIENLKKQCKEANRIIGVKEVFFYDLPDNRFDTIAFLDIVKKIEEIKSKIYPSVIFTHYRNDLNIDHRITYQAVITAARPILGESVKEIYAFEIPSSTEWNYPMSFSPQVFFDIEKTINLKLKAFQQYKSEIRNFPHPRSLEGIKLSARLWGIKVGLKYAEAFQVVRIVK